jgi:hypothetical protein
VPRNRFDHVGRSASSVCTGSWWLKHPFFDNFIKKPVSSQIGLKFTPQCGVRTFRLPTCGVRERSGGTVVGSFKIEGSSVGNSAPEARMKALLLEIVISML